MEQKLKSDEKPLAEVVFPKDMMLQSMVTKKVQLPCTRIMLTFKRIFRKEDVLCYKWDMPHVVLQRLSEPFTRLVSAKLYLPKKELNENHIERY